MNTQSLPSRNEPSDHDRARRQVLSLLQWLARVQQSYGSASANGARLVRWLPERGAFQTGTIGEDTCLELRANDLVLEFRDADAAAVHPFSSDEHSPAEVEAWLRIELLHRGLDPARIGATPAASTHFMAGDEQKFSLPDIHEALLELVQSLPRHGTGILVDVDDLAVQPN